jgi:hypothetical protein
LIITIIITVLNIDLICGRLKGTNRRGRREEDGGYVPFVGLLRFAFVVVVAVVADAE